MSKPKQPDLFKFVPIGILAVSMIGGWFTLQTKVQAAEKKIEAIETAQDKLSEDSGEVRVSQARTEEKIEAIVELLKDIKNKK